LVNSKKKEKNMSKLSMKDWVEYNRSGKITKTRKRLGDNEISIISNKRNEKTLNITNRFLVKHSLENSRNAKMLYNPKTNQIGIRFFEKPTEETFKVSHNGPTSNTISVSKFVKDFKIKTDKKSLFKVTKYNKVFILTKTDK